MSSNRKSSPWYSTSRAKRSRRGIELTLSQQALDALDALAGKGGSKSATVERLILEAFERIK